MSLKANNNKSITVIIAAAGASSRLDGYKGTSKQFIQVNGKPLLIYSLEKFLMIKNIAQIIVVSNDPAKTLDLINSFYPKLDIKVDAVAGGKLRQDSVYNGFCKINKNTDLVLIHDVARPLVNISDIEKCIEIASKSGSAVLAIPVVDTLKKAKYDNDELIATETINREGLFAVQTPQIFSYTLLLEAYKVYRNSPASELTNNLFTDEASMIELLTGKVNLVLGLRSNIKITYLEDLLLAESIFKNQDSIINRKLKKQMLEI